MENSTTIALDTTIRFERINAMLTGQGEMALAGNVAIQSLHLRGDIEWLYAVADVKGLYNGKIIVQFKVQYDNDHRKFTVHNLNIELADDSMFAKMAGKFVNSMFADKLDSKLEEVVNAKFTLMLNDILEQVKNLPLPKGGSLGFDAQSFKLYHLRTDGLGLHFIAALTGRAVLEY